MSFWSLVVNLLLYLLSSSFLLAWLPDRQTGVGFPLDYQQRVEAAEKAYRTGAVRADKRLGAIVGISNIREAVDIDLLNQQLGKGWRFMGVAGAGAGAFSVAENARILEQSTLRPDLVLVGSAPLQFLDSLLPGDLAPAPTPRQRVKQAATSVAWLYSRRDDVSVSTEQALLEARAKLFRAFDVRLPTTDSRSPWRP